MLLDESQLTHYRNAGYVLLENFFSGLEVEGLQWHASADLKRDSPRRVYEEGSELVRAVHGSHQVTQFFADLVRLPRLVRLAEQLLGRDVYVHQFKINSKKAFGGEMWEWHQDFHFWQHEDGMPEPFAVSFAIHLDEANDANGPLLFVPGSHRCDIPAKMAEPSLPPAGTWQDGAWLSTVSARLKYQLDPEALARVMQVQGVRAMTGPPGTLVAFDPRLVHGSVPNMSPFDRCLLIISYNRSSNRLQARQPARPAFLAARDFAPLVPLAADEVPDSGWDVENGGSRTRVRHG